MYPAYADYGDYADYGPAVQVTTVESAVDILREKIGTLGIMSVGVGETREGEEAVVVYVAGGREALLKAGRAMPTRVLGYPVVVKQVKRGGVL